MPYIYMLARQLENKEKIGDSECVTLIRHFTAAGWTGRWKQGAPVAGNKTIAEGTAIANFVNGRWPNLRHGNHSAFYLGQVSDGIYIIDQWPEKKSISRRFIRRKGKDSRGNFIKPTDNADAFFVIDEAMMPLRMLAPVLIFLMPAIGHEGPIRFECPQFIPEASVQLVSPKPGWKPFVSAPLYLNSAAPADGPPERLGILRGEAQKSARASWTHKYSLAGPFPEGKWLRCDYGMLGGFSLSNRLPDDIKECTVMGKKGEHAGESIIEVWCK